MMTWHVLQSIWPVLAVLAYLLVTAVLTVVTSMRKRAIDVHDRIRQCMELRQRYLSERPGTEE